MESLDRPPTLGREKASQPRPVIPVFWRELGLTVFEAALIVLIGRLLLPDVFDHPSGQLIADLGTILLVTTVGRVLVVTRPTVRARVRATLDAVVPTREPVARSTAPSAREYRGALTRASPPSVGSDDDSTITG